MNTRNSSTLKIGVIGYGYWGPNVVRNFYNAANATVACVADLSAKSLLRVHQTYPTMRVTTNPADVFTDPQIDAVAIVTPITYHFPLAKQALESGKHVFVEKPFTATTAQAEELIELADRKNLLIMVDHTFLFNGAVRKIHELISSGTLGNLYYYDSTRVNLGLFQHDANVVWDLAPHDLSIIDYLIEDTPEAVVATGEKHVNGTEDMAFITIYFPNKVIAHLNLNWLSPVKIRTTLIGGEKKMLVWNDLEADEKIKVYDKESSAPMEARATICTSVIEPATCGYPVLNKSRPSRARHNISCIVSSAERRRLMTAAPDCALCGCSRRSTGQSRTRARWCILIPACPSPFLRRGLLR